MALCTVPSFGSNFGRQPGVIEFASCGPQFCFRSKTDNDPNASVSVGRYLLAAAASGEVTQAIHALADGADCNFADPATGETALHRAARRNQLSMIELMAAAGADVNRHDSVNRTPLFVAADSGHLQAVQKLLTHGARLFPELSPAPSSSFLPSATSHSPAPPQPIQPTQPAQEGNNTNDAAFLAIRSTCPLATAAASGRWAVVAALLTALPMNPPSGPNPAIPLTLTHHPAALRSLRFLVWALASHKVFPHEVIAALPPRLPSCVIDAVRPAHLASTPLVLATGNDQQQLMKWLLLQGADPELGAPLLLCAGRFCHGSRACCVSTLLRRGARPHVAWADTPTDSPLQLAAAGDCFTHVHCLVAFGADVGGEAARVREVLYSPSQWEAGLDALLAEYGRTSSGLSSYGGVTAQVVEAGLWGGVGMDAACSTRGGNQHAKWSGLWAEEAQEEEEWAARGAAGGSGAAAATAAVAAVEAAEGSCGNSCYNRMPSDDAWYRQHSPEMELLVDGAELAESRKAIEELWQYGCSAVVSEMGGAPSAPHSLLPRKVLSAMQDVAGVWLSAAVRCRQQRQLREDLYDRAVAAGKMLLRRKRVAALAALSGRRMSYGGCGGEEAPMTSGTRQGPNEHGDGSGGAGTATGTDMGMGSAEAAAVTEPRQPVAVLPGLTAELRMEILALAGLAPPGVEARAVSPLPRQSCGCEGCRQ